MRETRLDISAKSRSTECPLCGSETESVLELCLNRKLNLPTTFDIRSCRADNFLFVAAGCQIDYDEYYSSLANDTVHGEVSGGARRSRISQLQASQLIPALGNFFSQPRRVLDFGCGQASLLTELAINFPLSQFIGYDPGPAGAIGAANAKALGLENVSILDFEETLSSGPIDLVIISHVVEHLIQFDLLRSLRDLTVSGGLLYLEVPDALEYPNYQRREFLYYFDRLHVNHFSPQALATLAARHGFSYLARLAYTFPYRDEGQYPALGMLFQLGDSAAEITSPSLLDAARRYVADETRRASACNAEFKSQPGLLVWGAGDNFFRALGNHGPLAGLDQLVVLDSRVQTIESCGRQFDCLQPLEGIRKYPWPVAIAVSEGKGSIHEQVKQIDLGRKVFFI